MWRAYMAFCLIIFWRLMSPKNDEIKRHSFLKDDIRDLDFMEPARTEDTSLIAHVEYLQVVQVRLGRGPCLGRIEQHWHDEGHVQTQHSCREMWLAPDLCILDCSYFQLLSRYDEAARI